MTLPIDLESTNFGPIRVTEDEQHFVVQIHPQQRERAKKILSRQWDGVRKAWIYQKTTASYDALTEEFQRDAAKFDIRRPKTKRPPALSIDPSTAAIEAQEWEIPVEQASYHPKLQVELGGIHESLAKLGDLFLGQSRCLDEMQSSQHHIRESLGQLNSAATDKPLPPTDSYPDALSLDKSSDLRVLETTLTQLAFCTAGKSKSLLDWLSKHRPLDRPRDFVTASHNLLYQQLEKIVGVPSQEMSFADLVGKAQNDNLIYNERFDSVQVIPTLRAMNAYRNTLIHAANLSASESLSRTVLYLINLAFVWPRIIMDDEE